MKFNHFSCTNVLLFSLRLTFTAKTRANVENARIANEKFGIRRNRTVGAPRSISIPTYKNYMNVKINMASCSHTIFHTKTVIEYFSTWSTFPPTTCYFIQIAAIVIRENLLDVSLMIFFSVYNFFISRE